MEIKIKSYSSQSSLINSIIFFILGGILFTSAEKVVSTLSIIIGIVMASAGIIEFTIYLINKKNKIQRTSDLARGIILIILSIIFIRFAKIVEQIIRFIIGAWILFSGINRLISILSMNNKDKKFIPLLIISALLICVGIYTIVIGDVILSTIGLIMMIYAGIDIAGYILYTKDKAEKEEEGATTLIIPEKEEKKEEKKAKKKTKNVKGKEEENKKD